MNDIAKVENPSIDGNYFVNQAEQEVTNDCYIHINCNKMCIKDKYVLLTAEIFCDLCLTCENMCVMYVVSL